MSLDGYITKTGDDLSFLSIVQQEGEDYGYAGFVQTVDTVIMGRRTYDWVLSQVNEFPHAGKESYILSSRPGPETSNLHFYNGDLKALVSTLQQREGKSIFVDGGADVVAQMQKADLIDEYILSVIPCFVGDGVRLFKDGRPEKRLHLLGTKQYPSGLVQLHYSGRHSTKQEEIND
jgi:dihydrofolate reductase